MASLQERVGVTEVQIDHLEEKIDDLKQDLRDMNAEIHSKLTDMQEASTKQHGELATKISNLEKVKDRWVAYTVGAIFVLSQIIQHWDIIRTVLH